jgi:hypothetical protein
MHDVSASSITLGLNRSGEKVDAADRDHTAVSMPVAGAAAKVL